MKKIALGLILALLCVSPASAISLFQKKFMQLTGREKCIQLLFAPFCKGGDLLIKVFQGEGFEALLAELKKRYERVVSRKPQASRSRSREVYLLARGFKGRN